MKVIQTTLFGEIFELDTEAGKQSAGECDRRCLEAREDRCVCSCGGRNHGVLNHVKDARLDDSKHYIYLGHIPEIRRHFEGYVCPSCGTPLVRAEILGYEHSDGLYVKSYNMKLWVFARCKCGYDTAWWKLEKKI